MKVTSKSKSLLLSYGCITIIFNNLGDESHNMSQMVEHL
jgi:hypothetical protein